MSENQPSVPQGDMHEYVSKRRESLLANMRNPKISSEDRKRAETSLVHMIMASKHDSYNTGDGSLEASDERLKIRQELHNSIIPQEDKKTTRQGVVDFLLKRSKLVRKVIAVGGIVAGIGLPSHTAGIDQHSYKSVPLTGHVTDTPNASEPHLQFVSPVAKNVAINQGVSPIGENFLNAVDASVMNAVAVVQATEPEVHATNAGAPEVADAASGIAKVAENDVKQADNAVLHTADNVGISVETSLHQPKPIKQKWHQRLLSKFIKPNNSDSVSLPPKDDVIKITQPGQNLTTQAAALVSGGENNPVAVAAVVDEIIAEDHLKNPNEVHTGDTFHVDHQIVAEINNAKSANELNSIQQQAEKDMHE